MNKVQMELDAAERNLSLAQGMDIQVIGRLTEVQLYLDNLAWAKRHIELAKEYLKGECNTK